MVASERVELLESDGSDVKDVGDQISTWINDTVDERIAAELAEE